VPGRSAEPEVISLSPVNPDPVASMRIWGADVTLGDQVFRVPAMDAAGWLEYLLADKIVYEDLFPGLAGPAAVVAVNQMLLDGEVSNEDLEQAILDLIEQVSGRAWWVTVKLCFSLRHNWESAGGELARNAVVPFGVPLSYWLDAAYATMIRLFMEGPKPKDASRWTHELTVPPASETREIDDVANANAFLAAFRAAQ
jgi:hypothetical protein